MMANAEINQGIGRVQQMLDDARKILDKTNLGIIAFEEERRAERELVNA